MNVSVLLYVPVRRRVVGVDELLEVQRHRVIGTGALYVSRFSGEAAEPTLVNAVPVSAALRRPGLQRLRQEERAVDQVAGVVASSGRRRSARASPAVETTLAVVDAM